MRLTYRLLNWLILLLLPAVAFAVPLGNVFNAAQPAAGYDKVLVLQPGQTYTGGFVAFNQKVAIRGNGALIDLQNSGVIAVGKGVLDVDGCIFINGGAAVNVSDEVRTTVSNCVFYQNDYGIQHFSSMGPLKVYNCIFMKNTNAVYTQEENLTHMAYNVAYQSSGDHFIAGCGS